MIKHALHGDDFYNICKFYVSIFNTDSIQEDEKKWKEVLQNAVLFVILSPFDNEQADMIHRLNSQVKLEQLPLYKEFLKCFITNELIKWARLEEIYAQTLKSTFVFSSKTEEGNKRYSVLHKRVIEHVIHFTNP
jgi:26S proteasome regulatory subunit N5